MMTDSYEDDIKTIKQEKLRWRRIIIGLISGAIILVLLCGVVNFTFFAAGLALGNVWPFSTPANTKSANMIAAYHVNQIPKAEPVVYDSRLYHQTFDTDRLAGWQIFADGWDVQNGVYYGTNTRADARTAAIYTSGYEWDNVMVSADVSAGSAPSPSSAQLLFRYQSDEVTGRCRLATRANGQRQLQLMTPEGQLIGTAFHYTTGEAYRLQATAVNNQLTCEIVGYADASLSATTTVNQGTVGFQNQYTSGGFDNLEVRVP